MKHLSVGLMILLAGVFCFGTNAKADTNDLGVFFSNSSSWAFLSNRFESNIDPGMKFAQKFTALTDGAVCEARAWVQANNAWTFGADDTIRSYIVDGPPTSTNGLGDSVDPFTSMQSFTTNTSYGDWWQPEVTLLNMPTPTSSRTQASTIFSPCYSLTAGRTYTITFYRSHTTGSTGNAWIAGLNSTTTTGDGMWIYSSGSWSYSPNNSLRFDLVGFGNIQIDTGQFINQSNYGLSTTSSSITATCPDFGIFTPLCDGVLWFFVPNMSQMSNQLASTKTLINSKFPFSYIASLQSAITTANSETSSTDMTLTLHYDTAISSSTSFGSWAPTLTMFSASTVRQYIPDTGWSLLRTLFSIAIYVGTVEFIYYGARNLFAKKV